AAEVDGQDAVALRRELLGERPPALLVEGRAMREHDAVAATLAVGVGDDRAAVGRREADLPRRLAREGAAREKPEEDRGQRPLWVGSLDAHTSRRLQESSGSQLAPSGEHGAPAVSPAHGGTPGWSRWPPQTGSPQV